jgi:nicotinamide-nucleotide amidase
VTSDIERVAEHAQRLGITIATAESLTCGALSATLGKGENASEWFAGGVIAYLSRVKFEVLGVDEGPVVTERCARQMADGVRRLLHADVAVAVTGVGGPDPEEGKPPGTVFVATSIQGRDHVTAHSFERDPSKVIDETVKTALHQLALQLRAGLGAGPVPCTRRFATHAPATDPNY